MEYLYGLAHVAQREPYDLHYLEPLSGVGFVLHVMPTSVVAYALASCVLPTRDGSCPLSDSIDVYGGACYV